MWLTDLEPIVGPTCIAWVICAFLPLSNSVVCATLFFSSSQPPQPSTCLPVAMEIVVVVQYFLIVRITLVNPVAADGE